MNLDDYREKRRQDPEYQAAKKELEPLFHLADTNPDALVALVSELKEDLQTAQGKLATLKDLVRANHLSPEVKWIVLEEIVDPPSKSG